MKILNLSSCLVPLCGIIFVFSCNRVQKYSNQNIDSIVFQYRFPPITNVNIVGGQFDRDLCKDVLISGVMNKLEIRSKSDYKLKFFRAIDYLHKERQESKSSFDLKSIIPGEIFGSPEDVGVNINTRDSNYYSLIEKYRDSTNLDISDNDLFEMSFWVADKTILDTWLACKIGKNPITLEFLDDPDDEFSILLGYNRTDAHQPPKVRIKNVNFSGALTPSGKNNLDEGKVIQEFEGVVQTFKRSSFEGGTIAVTVSGFPTIHLEVPGLEVVDDSPVYEEVWVGENEIGTPFSQLFTFGMPKCVDCRGAKNGRYPIIVANTITIDEKDGKLYKVERECAGPGCGWNYPYGNTAVILSDSTFFWRREIGGDHCTEIYRAYYKKKVRKCVKNCPVIGTNKSA